MKFTCGSRDGSGIAKCWEVEQISAVESSVQAMRKAAARLIGVVAVVVAFAGCGPGFTLVSHTKPVDSSKSGDTFGYRKWVSEKTRQDVVIIGIHGFCGASIDYANLGNHLLRHQPRTGVYAYEVRGQGSDPILERRGDIGDPNDWYRDLFAFTQLVQERHPDAKIVWFGESMGALIAAHAWREAPEDDPPCDGLVLSSPIVRFRDDIPAWTPGLLQVAATTLPLARVSLEMLSSGKDLQMTQSSRHDEQVKKNPYHVEQHTLRLLATLARHIRGMNDCAGTFRAPVLVLHGGNDFFNDDSDVRGFVARIPDGVSATYRNYPKSYHLLMYDEKREVIFRDVERWLNRLRAGKI
jgi:alpha-beta hydrolase superfamily lysophospholipase